MGAVGAAVDYSIAANARISCKRPPTGRSRGSREIVACDGGGGKMSNDGSIPAGATDALKIFNGQLVGRMGFTNVVPMATVPKTSGNATAIVDFTAFVPLKSMGLFGKTSITLTGTSSAANGTPLYATSIWCSIIPVYGGRRHADRYRQDGQKYLILVRLCSHDCPIPKNLL